MKFIPFFYDFVNGCCVVAQVAGVVSVVARWLLAIVKRAQVLPSMQVWLTDLLLIKIMVYCNCFLTICLFSPAWKTDCSHAPMHFFFLMMLLGEDSFLAPFFPPLSFSWIKFMCNTAGWGSSPLNELITSEARHTAGFFFQESVCFSLHQLPPMVLLIYGWFDLCMPPIFSRGSGERT